MAYPAMPTAQSNSPSPMYSNSISSMGSAPQPEQQSDPSANKAQMLVDNFGQIFQQLNTLAGQYPGAADKFNLVVEALKNWLATASDSIVSEGGGNSATY